MKTASRFVEIAGFSVGLLLVVGDRVVHWVALANGRPSPGWDWGSFLWAALLVAPYTLGRATAGQVWVKLGEGVAALFTRLGGKKDP